MNKKGKYSLTQKLQAFTLLNLMIGIFLSSFVVTGFYEATQFLREEINQYSQQKSTVHQLLRSAWQTQEYLDKAYWIETKEKSLTLHCTEQNMEIRQEGEALIMMQGDKTDTLSQKGNFEILPIPENQNQEIRIQFNWTEGDQVISYYYQKTYTAQERIQQSYTDGLITE